MRDSELLLMSIDVCLCYMMWISEIVTVKAASMGYIFSTEAAVRAGDILLGDPAR